MRILIVAVGKMKERGARELVDDYLKRIGRYCRVEEIELKDGDPEEVAARFAKAVPSERSVVVALEVDGKSWSSHRLADFVAEHEGAGTQNVVFLIGGSYGLPKVTSDAANVLLSLSAMTLPHRLARILLAEQIYRAFSILRGEPYSH
ncbi:MAG: 23S rRNA (pseudouridine(1915)-N(3))-methyltransferase RlmH [Sandaracinus sp.]|nr:23S rRNA (pseudouridine(1915)-N(3))-methyltransferase RlmH [Myxococcales bacterium]MCB9614913.1 23S rRNA (pseudouridine(1915)-N(3))-methyltransferase RlmH [Sandaracinus sp.]MCB9617696.1 23S rRNA (pseudouridine(1915)-N(3))-methyltransferase RlmH [Sandaracinus sp.]MCB9618666.1 23S rRNA (pseudouridine(1915)-N(3))-methyltransferase RlmH [Sandaracinus sp.]